MITEYIDTAAHIGSQGYQLQRIAKVAGHKVRSTVHVDAYINQSYAVAEILTTERGWSELLTWSTNGWFDTVPSYVQVKDPLQVRDALDSLVNELTERAVAVLDS